MPGVMFTKWIRSLQLLLGGGDLVLRTSLEWPVVFANLNRTIGSRFDQLPGAGLLNGLRRTALPLVYGKVALNGRIWIRRRIWYGNPFQVKFLGHAFWDGKDHVIQGRFRCGLLPILFEGFMLFMSTLFAIGVAMNVASDIVDNRSPLTSLSLLGPSVAFVAAQVVALLVAGRLASADAAVIERVLGQALSASGERAD